MSEVKRWRNMPLPDGLDDKLDLIIIKADVVLASDYDEQAELIVELKSTIQTLLNDVEQLSQAIHELEEHVEQPDKLKVGDLVVNDLDGLTYTISSIEPRFKLGAYSHLLGNIVGLVDLYGNETEVYEWEVTLINILDNE